MKSSELYQALMSDIDGLDEPVPCSLPEYQELFYQDAHTGHNTNESQFYKQIQEQDAKLICHTCPVRLICGQYALTAGEEYGVWGGMSPQDRFVLNKGRPIGG